MSEQANNIPASTVQDNTATEILSRLGLNTAEQVLGFIQSLQTQLNQVNADLQTVRNQIRPNNVPATTPEHPAFNSASTIALDPTPSVSDRMEDLQPAQPVVLSSVRLATPRHFSKQTTPGELQMWIQEMEAYIASGTVRGAFQSEAEKISLAASYLSGEARLHWSVAKQMSDLADPTDPDKINTLEQFFQHLREANTNWNEQEYIRRKYMQLRQKRSAGEFGTQLILLANQLIPRPTENEILERFKFGLQERIRRELVHVFDPPTNLRQFILLCDRIDKQLYSYRLSQNHHSYGSTFNALSHQQTKEPKKGTPEWTKWCHKENRCLECGKTGHRKSECRNLNRTPQQSRHSNRDNRNIKQITFDVSGIQHKDQQGNGSGRS